MLCLEFCENGALVRVLRDSKAAGMLWLENMKGLVARRCAWDAVPGTGKLSATSSTVTLRRGTYCWTRPASARLRTSV